jgi:sensor histidine kinase regulating citrate/malate metabolism
MSSVYDALTKAGKNTETISTRSLSWQGINLQWKIIIFVLGLFFVLIVNQLVGQVLRSQMDESAVLMTTNLSDAAATYLASKDLLQLKTTVTKYARLSRVAYVFIQDREGKVIAHSLGMLPPELQEKPTSDQSREVNRRELTFEGKTVYETRGPILDGRFGSAHIGVWAAAVEGDIYHALFMFVWPIAFGLLAAVIMVAVAARLLFRALRRVAEVRLNSQATSTDPLK